MTVKELIEELSKYCPCKEVRFLTQYYGKFDFFQSMVPIESVRHENGEVILCRKQDCDNQKIKGE